jgi:hypothetical protein
MSTQSGTHPQGYILQAQSGQWIWELWVDGEHYATGAGFDSEGDAIDGLYESNSHIENINLVLSKGVGL